MANDNTLKNIQIKSLDPNDPKNAIFFDPNSDLERLRTELNAMHNSFEKKPNGISTVQSSSSNQNNSPALSPTSQDIAAMQSPAITPIRTTPQTQQAQLPAVQASQSQLPANQTDNRPWWRRVIDGIISAGTKTVNWFKDAGKKASEGLFGTPGKFEQIPTLTDQGNSLLNALISDSFQRLGNPNPIPQALVENALPGLENPYQGFPGTEGILPNALQNLQNPQAGFEPYEKAAIKHYQEQTIPALLESFSGATTSPYIQQHLKNSAQGLETMLNAQRVGYGQQNRQQSLAEAQFGSQFGLNNREHFLRQLQLGSQLGQTNRQQDLSQAQLGLTPPFTTQYTPGKTGLVQEILPTVAKAGVAAGLALL